MGVVVTIPDDLAQRLAAEGNRDLACGTLEALAVEAYRAERLTDEEMRRLLGFEGRSEMKAFLKARGVLQEA